MDRYSSRLLHPDAVRELSGTAGFLLRKAAVFLTTLMLCSAAAASPAVVVIPLNGAVGPASADFVVRALSRAAEEHAQLAVLEIDTPGGLDPSMRSIIKATSATLPCCSKRS